MQASHLRGGAWVRRASWTPWCHARTLVTHSTELAAKLAIQLRLGEQAPVRARRAPASAGKLPPQLPPLPAQAGLARRRGAYGSRELNPAL